MNDVYKTRTWTQPGGEGEGNSREGSGVQRKEEVDGVAGDVGPASVPDPATAPLPSSCLTIFGGLGCAFLGCFLSLGIPPPPVGQPRCAFQGYHILLCCVVSLTLLFSSLLPLPSSSAFFLLFVSLRVLFTPLFPALDFHFHCNFICLPHATQSGHSDGTPPPSLPLLCPPSLPACACCNASVGRRTGNCDCKDAY